MSIQTSTNESTVNQVSQSSDLSELPFADYEKVRRGEVVESAEKSAPGKSPEQKSSKNSESLETEAEGEESDEASQDVTDDPEKPKKKGGFQRRIDKLNAAKADAQREVEYWKAQALKSSGEPKKEDPKPDTAVEPSGKPDPDQYETHAEYVEALTDWKIEQRESKAKSESEKSRLISEHEKAIKSHTERVKAFADKTDDFEEALESLNGVRSATVEQIIVESENGPELLYALAKDPAEAKRICSLSPIAAAREMGKLELKIASKASETKNQETKKITTAPKPIEPVGGTKGASVSKSIDDPNISFSDYEKARRKQMKRR